jgi:hypothetical protein
MQMYWHPIFWWKHVEEVSPNACRSSPASINDNGKWKCGHAQHGLRIVSILIYRMFIKYVAPL